ncbi:MAG: hypothetical protein KAW82_06000, partial [Desulfurellaceae bacterium]|nr:hypothetical protein [Desulfurellaceae bacterium]
MKARMNEKGVALIIALIVALIILILGSIALYVSIKSTKISGSFRQYRASIEAAKGGYEETKYIIDYIKVNSAAPSISDGNFTNFTNFKDKVKYATTDSTTSVWTDDAKNPDKTVSNPDITLDIGNYYVYVKLINTAIGNTALGGSKTLGTGGVTTGKAGASTVTPPKKPFLYTIKIVSKHKTTDDEAAVSL